MSAPSYDATRKAIEAFLVANWGTVYTLIYENAPDPPSRTATWVRVSIRPTDCVSADVSSGTLRTTGSLYFQIFSPEGGSSRPNMLVADKIAGHFNQLSLASTVGQIIFDNAVLIYVGQTDVGNLQTNVMVDYRIDS
jgi:hypothetical protein